jgi:hypothetical protein
MNIFKHICEDAFFMCYCEFACMLFILFAINQYKIIIFMRVFEKKIFHFALEKKFIHTVMYVHIIKNRLRF